MAFVGASEENNVRNYAPCSVTIATFHQPELLEAHVSAFLAQTEHNDQKLPASTLASSLSPNVQINLSDECIDTAPVDIPLDELEHLLELDAEVDTLTARKAVSSLEITSQTAMMTATTPVKLGSPESAGVDASVKASMASQQPASSTFTCSNSTSSCSSNISSNHTDKLTLKPRQKKGKLKRKYIRHRPRACEMDAEQLQHQRKLSREAAQRRRARWLEEEKLLAEAMAKADTKHRELLAEHKQLKQELAILRDIIGGRQ
eukprot:TRINITY_DN11542_c0_g2_i1.p1 TRINITY_DN11542_c0_g2~~TRINITY_DN11542_c0_g2_i1.p1  ORF type:complete len:261 (+),score=54.52 TRINITY_DN11542_c0_g2_i1:488-1270(+)